MPWQAPTSGSRSLIVRAGQVADRGAAHVIEHSRRGHPLTERLRHTHGMPSQPSSSDRFSFAELTVRSAQSDLLEVDPLESRPERTGDGGARG